jgi:hypothetical protein
MYNRALASNEMSVSLDVVKSRQVAIGRGDALNGTRVETPAIPL